MTFLLMEIAFTEVVVLSTKIIWKFHLHKNFEENYQLDFGSISELPLAISSSASQITVP